MQSNSLSETARSVLSRLEMSPWSTKTAKLFEQLPAHGLLSPSVCAATNAENEKRRFGALCIKRFQRSLEPLAGFARVKGREQD